MCIRDRPCLGAESSQNVLESRRLPLARLSSPLLSLVLPSSVAREPIAPGAQARVTRSTLTSQAAQSHAALVPPAARLHAVSQRCSGSLTAMPKPLELSL